MAVAQAKAAHKGENPNTLDLIQVAKTPKPTHKPPKHKTPTINPVIYRRWS